MQTIAPASSLTKTEAPSQRTAFSWLAPLLVFVAALAVRLLYNFQFCEHRLSDIGDGYLYLITGNKLLTVFANSHSLPQFVSNLGGHSHAALDSLLTSDVLADRLLLDGPVYPLYLCIAQWLLHVPTNCINFSQFALGLATTYSLTDAITCVLAYTAANLAFGRRAALIAGLLYAVYPPAVINTANSFSEPFAAFCLTAFACMLLWLGRNGNAGGRWNAVAWLLFGIITGMTMLAKPIFVVVPAVVAAVFIAARWTAGVSPAPWTARVPRAPVKFAALAIGLTITLSPYLWFTWHETGKPTICVNRAPGYNISMGNQLASDGCISYSPQFMSPDSGQAIKHVVAEASSHPVAFGCLYLRKVMRLWCAGWNDFQINFPVSQDWQDVWHQIVLFSAISGIWWLWRTGPENSGLESAGSESKDLKQSPGGDRHSYAPQSPGGDCHRNSDSAQWTFVAGIALTTIVAVHCLYILFIPMPRYAFPSMAIVSALAAYAWASRGRTPAFLAVMALAAVGFAVRKFVPTFVPYLMVPGLSYTLAAIVNVALWAIFFALLAAILWNSGRGRVRSIVANVIIIGLLAVAVSVSTACFVSDPSSGEFACRLSPGQCVERQIVLPAHKPCLLLVDAQSEHLTPSLSVKVNGHRVDSEWVPWLQTRTDIGSRRFLEILATQSHATGTPLYSYRQWWALAVPAEVLKTSGSQLVSITSELGGDTVYGDYNFNHQGTRRIPSLYSYSWIKAFASLDRGDARIYDIVADAHPHASRWFDGREFRTDDLAAAPGVQRGDYRVFLATENVVDVAAAPLPQALARFTPGGIYAAPTDVYKNAAERTIIGSNPYSFALASNISVGAAGVLSAGSQTGSDGIHAAPALTLSFDVKGDRSHGSGYVVTEVREGDNQPYRPSWQPESIPTTGQWEHISMSQVLPANMTALAAPSISLIASPFHPDLLFLHKSQALKRKMFLRNIKISLAELPGIEPNANRWSLF